MAKGDAILLGDLPSEIAGHRGQGGQGSELSQTKAASAAGASAVEDVTDMAVVARTLFRWARQDDKLKVIPAVERQLIIEALAETKGNQVQAAKLLGITRATLRKRVEKFGIKQELSIK